MPSFVENAIRLENESHVPDEILDLVDSASFVLLGEASHGTHEFYKCRAEITKRLIGEKQFSGVAVEADFPDAYRVNRYVQGSGKDQTAAEALGDFQRFPRWMWRNKVVLKFVEWLREFSAGKEQQLKAGFYGIDLYSLHSSMAAVLEYLDRTDPQAATRARYRYSCFEHYGDDPQHYGYAASFDLSRSCEDEVVRQLVDLRSRASDYINRDGFVARDEYFFAERNAELVRNAEEYYREMFHGRVSSWNLRDRHMAETLSALAKHLQAQDKARKIVVWAHNSHLGDASATEMGQSGEWSVGQLMRQKYGDEVVSIGFTTYSGTVTAATNWGEPPDRMHVRDAIGGSVEDTFHKTGISKFFLNLRNGVEGELAKPRLERAIGVIYRPETERESHYFLADLPRQFDGVIHFDATRAVEPLDAGDSETNEDLPETFPEGV
ncbi:MAG: erythromycin esterase family protein [Pyrinomonadaceae bacterium]